MRARKLAVDCAFEFVPDVHRDNRGLFVSPYQEPAFLAALGRPLFPVARTNISESKRGVVRGIHYTATPPGSAKYIHCARGRVQDFLIDIRPGSPTFGQWDSVVLDGESFRGVYVPVGVGHAFVALEDGSLTCYLLSASYVPELELALAVDDSELALPVAAAAERVMSHRDRIAPTLAEARSAGLLPDYATCLEIEAKLLAPTSTTGR